MSESATLLIPIRVDGNKCLNGGMDGKTYCDHMATISAYDITYCELFVHCECDGVPSPLEGDDKTGYLRHPLCLKFDSRR